MPRFVILLRGVNVGKGNRVPMADFRAQLEALGYTEVRTLLNSGNAVVTGAIGASVSHAKDVHAALLQGLGLDLQVVVISSSEFGSIVREIPFTPAAEQHSRLLVAFAQEPAAAQALKVLKTLVKPTEQFHVGRRAAYLLCTDGILQSKAATALLGKSGQSVTTRNWATVLKLNELLPGAA